MILLKMAWAPGAVLPNCSRTTGVTPSVKSLQVVAISLAICPAFRHFFSEKFFSHIQVDVDSVDLHVQPELGALRFNDVHVSTVDGSDTARGRLSILLNLIRNEHGLLSSGRQACLPGKFGYEVSNAIMSACVKAFCATRSMSAVRIKDVLASLAPRGGCGRTAVPSLGQESPVVG